MRYTAAQWKPVARLLGRWGADTKARLETIADEYAALPDKAADAARYREARSASLEIAAAARAFAAALERHGADFDIRGESLIAALDGISQAEEDAGEKAKQQAPKNREDRRRRWLLDRLVRFWVLDLGREGGVVVDRTTGAVAEKGIVAFLIAASRPILPTNHPVTAEQARHAVREWVRPSDDFRQRYGYVVASDQDLDDALASADHGE